jgi:hypothetical protein
MKRTSLLGAAFVTLLSFTTSAQTRPAFEVASVRPSADQVSSVRVGFQATGSQVRVTAMSIKDYVGSRMA